MQYGLALWSKARNDGGNQSFLFSMGKKNKPVQGQIKESEADCQRPEVKEASKESSEVQENKRGLSFKGSVNQRKGEMTGSSGSGWGGGDRGGGGGERSSHLGELHRVWMGV